MEKRIIYKIGEFIYRNIPLNDIKHWWMFTDEEKEKIIEEVYSCKYAAEKADVYCEENY